LTSQLEGKLKTASYVVDQLMTEKRGKEEKWMHGQRDITTKMKDLGGMKASKKAKYVTKTALYAIVNDIE
jgi:hypothetical protein